MSRAVAMLARHGPHRGALARARSLDAPGQEVTVSAVATPGDDTHSGDPVAWWQRPDVSRRAALAVFVACLVVGGYVILFHLGRDRWFFSDEWSMIAGRDVAGFGDLFRPNNAHWSTLPSISYSAMWHLFGLESYRPYQGVLLLLHLLVVVLIRVVMRRSGVNPWLATAAAGALILFGPGYDDIIWAFQIGFVGAIALGLIHLLLADHEGGLDRRDALGLLAGLLALMCSGVGVAMVAAVGGAVLVSRGWRAAAFHIVPLAAAYGTYVLLADPQSNSPAGRPPFDVAVGWMRNSVVGTFVGIGHHDLVAVALAVVLGVGAVVGVRSLPLAELRRRAAGPLALAGAALVFAAATVQGRWQMGEQAARSPRYLYVTAVLAVPLLALAAELVGRRWRWSAPVLVVLFVIPVPGNANMFGSDVYGDAFFDTHERIIGQAAFAPFADEVPRDVRPLPNAFITPDLDMGFLIDARDAGKLREPPSGLTPETVEELRVRLGFPQRAEPVFMASCRIMTEPVEIRPDRGEVFAVRSPISVRTVSDGGPDGPPAYLKPADGGRLTAELDDLHLRIGPGFGAKSFEWCEGQ